MRSAQLFRNDNALRFLRPIWDTSRSQKFGRSSLIRKKQEEPDPYEGNFNFTECDQFTKVTVIGAAGRVGKTLSLLLKTCPFIDQLCLFDTDKSVKGIGVDISHIDTKCCVSYVCGMRNIQQALNAPDVVIIAAGCPVSPNLSGRKLFEKNAPIIAGLSEACARFCPKACVVLITSPINSLLPVMGEVYQIITNRIPSRKMFGLTTLDVVRANTFVAEVIRKDPNSVIVPVIGGASQDTIVPVISQIKPCCRIKRGEMIALTECLKRAEENLTDCQNCGTRGASTLSTAYAGFRFTTSLLMALKGAENIIECAFVKSDVIPELEYLASPLKLGMRGIEYNFGYPPLSDYELAGFEQSAAVLMSDIRMGKAFVRNIEETIQKGLIWKRLSDGNLKAFEEGKYHKQKESVKFQGNKTQSDRFTQSHPAKRLSERAVEGVKEQVLQPNVLTQQTYSDGVRNWAAQSSLRLFCSGDMQGNCNEITTDSISADLDPGSCREDGEKHLEELLEEKQTDGETQNESKTVRALGELYREPSFGSFGTPSLFQVFNKSVQLARKYHTMQNDRAEHYQINLKKKNKIDEYKRYLMEDRQKVLVPVSQPKPPINRVIKVKIKSVHGVPKIAPSKNFRIRNDQYKSLNATAKQKFRNFNVQKKFNPSASALFLVRRKRKDGIYRNVGWPVDTIKKKEYLNDEEKKYDIKDNDCDENKINKDFQQNKEESKEHLELVVRSEKDELMKCKDLIFQQIRQLKRENEILKRKISEISHDKTAGSSFQAQSETLELEKTKLKACWLIMSSTLDAFSNFCKKFTSKPEAQLMVPSKEVDRKQDEQEDQESEEEYEDAVETQDKTEDNGNGKYDDKYFKFLEKLMEDQMESRIDRGKKRSQMKK